MELHGSAGEKNSQPLEHPALSQALRRLIRERNGVSVDEPGAPLTAIGGSLALHCSVDLENRSITEAAAMATRFRGYESLLPGLDLNKVGLVSSTASGICGGVHATASALCLEMALGLKPPPLGIIIRNLLLSCQYLNDNTMHLFVLCGPDYSRQRVEAGNPEVWQKAQHSACRHASTHGYRCISDIMTDLNKPTGKLYKQALSMVGLARKAYTILGGKYPHSESIIPGGVSISIDAERIGRFATKIKPFVEFTRRTTALWNDVFDFMLDADPRYADVGRSAPSMLDFGQWDHEEYYDGTYRNCNRWGEKRWSTPGAIIDGQLRETDLGKLNAGLEEFPDYSFFKNWVDSDGNNYQVRQDPAGNAIKPNHPWNKRLIHQDTNALDESQPAYSWGSCLTWNRHVFEVGAYARLYLTASARKIAPTRYMAATGNSMEFCLPAEDGVLETAWRIPVLWNAFERNRARAYVLAFNLGAIHEHTDRALALLKGGHTEVATPMTALDGGERLGVGLWGASRGFLAHWARICDGKIENYQLSIPSRVNAGTRTPWGEPGPCEQAVLNTPIIESSFTGEHDFLGIDIHRAIQSFDPCMSCTTHILIAGSGNVLNGVVDTGFPI